MNYEINQLPYHTLILVKYLSWIFLCFQFFPINFTKVGVDELEKIVIRIGSSWNTKNTFKKVNLIN